MIPAMKAAIAWQAEDMAWTTVRPPLVELDNAQAAQLRETLQRQGFTMPDAALLRLNS